MNSPGGRCEWSFFCTCLISCFIVPALVTPSVWYIYGHVCAMQTFLNKVERELHILQKEMEQINLEYNDKSIAMNQQLETIGKKSCQKFAEVEQMIQEINSCPQSDFADMDGCASFDELDDNDESSVLRADFALESTGGSIISTGSTTEPFESESTNAWVFGIHMGVSNNGPEAVIQADVQPGECWAFKGNSGSVTIRLLGYVFITGVTLYHIPKSIAPLGNINSAPKEFNIVGLTSKDDTNGKVFGLFTYNSNGPPAQFFEIDGCFKSYELIQLNIHSNHGSPLFTCVYRLQVHGNLDETERNTLVGH